jgi:hypothetical protein
MPKLISGVQFDPDWSPRSRLVINRRFVRRVLRRRSHRPWKGMFLSRLNLYLTNFGISIGPDQESTERKKLMRLTMLITCLIFIILAMLFIALDMYLFKHAPFEKYF